MFKKLLDYVTEHNMAIIISPSYVFPAFDGEEFEGEEHVEYALRVETVVDVGKGETPEEWCESLADTDLDSAAAKLLDEIKDDPWYERADRGLGTPEDREDL